MRLPKPFARAIERDGQVRHPKAYLYRMAFWVAAELRRPTGAPVEEVVEDALPLADLGPALPRSFEDLLAEARGYRLSLVLAHQHMGQLTKDVRDALAANARTKVVFTCSPEDAFVLERHFAPDLSAYDLSHLATFQSACRPCVRGGQGGQAFIFRTEALPDGSKARAEAVRRRSAELFAVPRGHVEDVIDSRQMGAVTVLLPPELRRRSRERSVGRSLERSPERSSPLDATPRETAGERP